MTPPQISAIAAMCEAPAVRRRRNVRSAPLRRRRPRCRAGRPTSGCVAARRCRASPRRHTGKARARAPIQQVARRNRPSGAGLQQCLPRHAGGDRGEQSDPVDRHAVARSAVSVALDHAHRALRLAVGRQEGAADILAKHAQDHRLHAGDQQDHRHRRGPAGWCVVQEQCLHDRGHRADQRRAEP